MTFASLIDEAGARDQQVTVYRHGGPPEIEQWLADHGVSVVSRSIPPAWPGPFIEIETDGEVVGTIGVDAVEGLLEPPIRRPTDRNAISEGYRVLFEILERTLFSSMRRRELLAVSREIEARAFRVGEGMLHVSFQRLSAFSAQTAVYRTLATETGLDIHIYGVDDWTPPAIAGITYHAGATAQVKPYWVIAYDGGADETQACGLVAQERADEYTGFWTNDSETVETVTAALPTE